MKTHAANHQEVAEFFGVSVATVKTSWSPSGMPAKTEEGYSIPAIIRWKSLRDGRWDLLAGVAGLAVDEAKEMARESGNNDMAERLFVASELLKRQNQGRVA